MLEAPLPLVKKIDQFDRLCQQKEGVSRKLERCCDAHRKIVYRCLLVRIDKRMQVTLQGMMPLEIFS